MPEIKFDTGLVSYSLNGACDVCFNPTDSAFAERLFGAFDALDKKQDEYKESLEKVSGNREAFDLIRKLDSEMREMIDGIFGEPVCNKLFGTMNVYAFADGFPVWANLLLAIMDELDASVAREKSAMNPRISKYTAKYHK